MRCRSLRLRGYCFLYCFTYARRDCFGGFPGVLFLVLLLAWSLFEELLRNWFITEKQLFNQQ